MLNLKTSKYHNSFLITMATSNYQNIQYQSSITCYHWLTIVAWSSRKESKSVTTCFSFQIIFILIHQKNLKTDTCIVNPCNIMVYITLLLDPCITSIMYFTYKWLVLTLTFTLYLNKVELLKPVTCCYRFPTHSAWSHHI